MTLMKLENTIVTKGTGLSSIAHTAEWPDFQRLNPKILNSVPE